MLPVFLEMIPCWLAKPRKFVIYYHLVITHAAGLTEQCLY